MSFKTIYICHNEEYEPAPNDNASTAEQRWMLYTWGAGSSSSNVTPLAGGLYCMDIMVSISVE